MGGVTTEASGTGLWKAWEGEAEGGAHMPPIPPKFCEPPSVKKVGNAGRVDGPAEFQPPDKVRVEN